MANVITPIRGEVVEGGWEVRTTKVGNSSLLKGEGVTGTKVVQNFTASRNPVTSPGGGVRDPETKSVGNFLKRVDPQTKLVYGVGKCLKNTKNY